MATSTSLSLTRSVKITSSPCTVPNDDVARLMYYLHCITTVLGSSILSPSLLDYQNYHLLSPAQRSLVLKTSLDLPPSLFTDKLIFRDDAEAVVATARENVFLSLTAACDFVRVQRDFVLGGRVRSVTKVMFFTSGWERIYYSAPAARLSAVVYARRENQNRHQATCDGCKWRFFTGPRFKCNNCYDYDLCEGCYEAGKHTADEHDFRCYEYPNDAPVYLPVRSTFPPPAPSPPSYTSIPQRTTPSQPAPAPDRKPPLPPPPKTNAPGEGGGLFYESMSMSELRAFLSSHGVEVDNTTLTSRETLCKSVWETHCDSMSLSELNTFLSSSNISTAACKSITDRREAAKAAFTFREASTRRLLGSTSAAGSGDGLGWREDDIVVFTGLSKADMNGRVGRVQRVDAVARKVTVWVEDLGKAFKVKYENVAMYVEKELGCVA